MGSEGKSMEYYKGFTRSRHRNYMILKPEKASTVDLISILVSSDLKNRDFVESSAQTELSFRHRWMIFVSTLAQKLLLRLAKPMALMGLLVNMWLNFLSNNPNIFVFIINLVQGTSIPDRDSANYVNFIGNIDNRKKLDRDIKPVDGCKYYSALCMMASKAAYENKVYIETIVKDHWKMEYLGFYNCWNDYQGKATTTFFILRDNSDEHDTIVVAFRGTEPFDAEAWCTDIDLSHCYVPEMGNAHRGFMRALGMEKGDDGWPSECKEDQTRKQPLAYYFIRVKLKALLSENEKTKFVVTGHSLGGALAILFPAILVYHNEELLLQRLEGIYTYGQPRVGDAAFGNSMEKKLKEHKIQYCRFVYCNDIVPRLPYDDKDHWFKHFGNCLYFNSLYQGQILRVLPNKNYFQIIYALPMMINACFELVRSFTIGYFMGPFYKEGWLLRFGRIFGLMIPGVSAHSPQDYVNSTRLGSSDVPEEMY